MSNILKTNPPSLVLAIQYNYDNTEGLTPEALLAYWAALTEAAKEDEPRRSFAIIHAALPFTASTSFSLDLGGYEVFKQTEALAELFHRAQRQAAPTSAQSERHAQAVQLLREAQADLKWLCEEHDLDTSTHSGTTLAKVNQFLTTHTPPPEATAPSYEQAIEWVCAWTNTQWVTDPKAAPSDAAALLTVVYGHSISKVIADLKQQIGGQTS